MSYVLLGGLRAQLGGSERANIRRSVDHYLRTVDMCDELMSVMRTLTGRVASGATLEEVLGFVFDQFRPFLPYDRLGFADVDVTADRVTKRWARTDGPLLMPIGYSVPLKSSSLEMVLQFRRPRILNDLADYLRRRPQSDSTRTILREGFRSSLTCPLFVEDRPVGFLFFSSRQPNTYSNMHTATFEQIAAELSLCLLIASERKKAKEAISACVHVVAGVLGIPGDLIGARATRISELARSVAVRLQLSNVWKYELAGLMSQIGSVTNGGQDQAADSPSEQSADDPDAVKQACSRAQELVARAPQLHDIAMMVCGQANDYADMMEEATDAKAMDIALGASIIRLAREFDELVHAGCSEQEAIEEFEATEGHCPDAVEALAHACGVCPTFIRYQIGLDELAVGMKLAKPVVTKSGIVLAAAGRIVTEELRRGLRDSNLYVTINEPLTVLLPSGIHRVPPAIVAREPQLSEMRESWGTVMPPDDSSGPPEVTTKY